MSPLEQVDAITAEFGDRVRFIAVPNYLAAQNPEYVYHGLALSDRSIC